MISVVVIASTELAPPPAICCVVAVRPAVAGVPWASETAPVGRLIVFMAVPETMYGAVPATVEATILTGFITDFIVAVLDTTVPVAVAVEPQGALYGGAVPAICAVVARATALFVPESAAPKVAELSPVVAGKAFAAFTAALTW